MLSLSRGRTWLGLLILLSAGVFAIGVAVERSTVHQDSHSHVTASTGTGDSGTDEAGGSSDNGGHDTGKAGTQESSTTSETVFGVNVESTGLVLTVVGFSVALALAVWFLEFPAILLLAIAFGVGAAVFDGREVIHQGQEGSAVLVLLAGLTALLHVGVAVVAWWVRQRSVGQAMPVQSYA